MKSSEVKIGATYWAKVSKVVVPVTINRENPRGGWWATNTVTGRDVQIRGPQRLRSEVKPDGGK